MMLLFINKNKKRNIILLCILVLIIFSIIISLLAYNRISTNYVLKNFNSNIIGYNLDYIRSVDHSNMIKSTNDDGSISYSHKYKKDIFKSKNKWTDNLVTYTFKDNKLCEYSVGYTREDDSQFDNDTGVHLLEVENYFMDKYGDGECKNNEYTSDRKYIWKTDHGYITVYTICNGVISISLSKNAE